MVRIGLLVVYAVAGGPTQTLLWAVALAVDYAGIYLAGAEGWRVPAPRLFAERHGVIVIIALGGSLIAVEAGMSGFPLTGPAVVVAVLGLAVAVALWWPYFDVVGPVAERRLQDFKAPSRPGSPAPTPMHFPMVAGIICSAAALWPLFGGVAVYLLAHLGFQLRNIGSINVPRGVTAAALLLAPLFLGDAPALVSLGLISTVLVALVSFEVVRYRGPRPNPARSPLSSVTGRGPKRRFGRHR